MPSSSRLLDRLLFVVDVDGRAGDDIAFGGLGPSEKDISFPVVQVDETGVPLEKKLESFDPEIIPHHDWLFGKP